MVVGVRGVVVMVVTVDVGEAVVEVTMVGEMRMEVEDVDELEDVDEASV